MSYSVGQVATLNYPRTPLSGLVAAAGTLVVSRHRRELLLPGHRGELEQALVAADSGVHRETSLGVGVSRHVLPDGRR